MTKTRFWGPSPFCKGGHLATKMNITFFVENEALNIFLSNNFFEVSNFPEKMAKKILGDMSNFSISIFKINGHLMSKIKTAVFITNYIFNIFMLNNFFRIKQYFPRKLQKSVVGTHLTIL